jgi:DNA-binding transcriptional MerR regulator
MASVKIGELANKAGITVSTIRFYEKQGLMPKPGTRESGYREYTELDFERLKLIMVAKRQRFPLRLIRVIVTAFDEGENPCAQVAELVRARLKGINKEIEDLQRIERNLRAQLESWEKGEAPTAASMCAILYS